ncbi:MAG: hypothetical protein GY745_00190 [Actinomycetia bacterium]|nr:hypothetical protein [Actinomycetes bacterium]
MSTPRPDRTVLRALLARVTPSHLLTVAAALAAFILVVGLLHQQGQTQEILAAATDLSAGDRLGPGAVRVVVLPADTDLAALVPADHDLTEVAVSRPVAAGAPLRGTDLQPLDTHPAGSRLSIPVEPERAVGGQLRLLDRIDVISVVDGSARVVAAGLLVVDLPAADGGPFVASGPWYVVVEVDAEEALAVAVAIDAGAVQLARSAEQGEEQS